MPKTRIINGNVVKENISYERESINQVDFCRRLDCAFLYFVEIHILRIIFICKYRYIFPYMNIQRSKKDYFSVNFLMGQKIIFLISHSSLNALMILWLQAKNMVLFIFLHNLTFPPKIHVQVINNDKRFTEIKSSKKPFELHRI